MINEFTALALLVFGAFSLTLLAGVYLGILIGKEITERANGN